MARPRVGVLGLGAVGAPVAAGLLGLGTVTLRAGVRSAGAALAGGGAAESAEVVVLDGGPAGEALDRFCAGCDLVVNCASPAGGLRDAIAAAALRAGAGYLDPGGGESDLARLGGLCSGQATLVLGAGVQPGLSELVPRWLASQGAGHPLALTAYLATLDRMTPGSAAEFLAGLADRDGRSGALWLAGARLPGRLAPEADAVVPFFPDPVVAYPYLNAETARLGRLLPIEEIRWFTVFESGGALPAVLARLGQQATVNGDHRDLVSELIGAAAADLGWRQPVQQLVCELAGRGATRVAVLRATSTYELTATVTVLTARRMLEGTLPPGAHLAGEVLPPQVVTELAGQPGLAGLHVLDQSLADCAMAEEGVI